MEGGGEVGGPSRSWLCLAWRNHVLSIGCRRGGQRAQGTVNEVGFERGYCKLLFRGAAGECQHPRAVIPN